MGSKSDWDTLRHTDAILSDFDVPHECRIVSAHRTPVEMADYAREARPRGLKVIIAGAGGAAHLPGMVAAHTALPVIGSPSRATRSRASTRCVDRADAGGVPVADRGDRQGWRDSTPRSSPSRSWPFPIRRCAERLEKFRADQTARVKQDTLE
jgi:5-(carboxyamino)imidazole ribonucleotide mutase